MRTINLDPTIDCSGQLAHDDDDHPIGCAMGEVLFQAGVPLDVLQIEGTSANVLQNYDVYRRMVRSWLGLWDTTDEWMIRQCTRIETVYDLFVTKAWTPRSAKRADALLIRLGRRIGVEFVLQQGCQRGLVHEPLAECPRQFGVESGPFCQVSP